MVKTAKIYRLPTVEEPADESSDSSSSEHVEIENIELRGAEEPAKNGEFQREHTRVQHREIKARFIVGAKPKRFRPFTRAVPCEIADISIGGACILSTKRLYKNETITLYLSCPGEDSEEVSIVAEVVRSAGTDKALYKYGLQFSGTMPHGELQTIICRKAIEKKVGGCPRGKN